jgi:hypothetical protein
MSFHRQWALRELLLASSLTLFTACGGASSSDDADKTTSEKTDANKMESDAGATKPKSTQSAGSPAIATEQAKKSESNASEHMPCDVAKALVKNCQKCHGVNPTFGAPMPLVKLTDLRAASKTNADVTVAEAAHKRLNDAAKPMPPGAAISKEDKQILNDWFEGGMPLAKADAGPCYTGAPTHDDAYFKAGLTAKDGETCYNFTAHNGQKVDDKTPYSVKPGEHYEQFYFKVPWGKDKVMTRFGGKFDNLAVLHHWLLFTSARPASAEGTHETTSGSTLGDSSELIGGWAVGGDQVEFPDDMGLELPADGMLNAQWHYYNQGTENAEDSSSVQVCVVPRDKRKNVASLTFLGTENLGGLVGMPARQVSQYGGTCLNRSSGPITIWGFTPHMHKLGRNMKVTVKRKDGSMETPFDKAFDFNSQITYAADPAIVLEPGDSITSTCTFDNDTNASVGFGPSSNQEMCYNFTMAYPAHALDNSVLSLIGAKNTCW